MSRSKREGFTLIELLVVIAIIAVLAALMFGGIKAAYGNARRAHCTSNLHQIGVAVFAYSDDYAGWLPNAYTLGNFPFRIAPGMRDPRDPRSLPERFGLAALLDKAGYLKGQSPAWVCIAQPHQWMKDGGNTYAFFKTSVRGFLNLAHGRASNKPLVWDNYQYYPYTSGFRAPDDFPSGYTIDDQKAPHEYGAFKRYKARNFLYGDGHVTSQFDQNR